jgi:16S rRNA (guanine527-N7)-methyltransferase
MASHPGGPAGELERVLADARDLGFLGAPPLDAQIAHARGFAAALTQAPRSFLDLGSGGGLPGLVVAGEWPTSTGVLLDANHRRAEFLEDACRRLHLGPRVRVVCERAEVAGRDPLLREQFDAVTARAFGRPPVVAECGSPFLRVGGRLVVSEPPHETARWDADALSLLGMELEVVSRLEARYVVMRRIAPVDDRWPRRTGVPTKRPLWR